MKHVSSVAYSYMRFSTPDQRKGDSIRRQMALADGFVERHRLRLDTTLRFVDAGVSGHKGLHRSSDKYALGYFLSLVTSGRIAPGSHLIVESLDRLSREDVDEALELLLSLTRSGIKVVQLLPTEIVYQKPVEPMKLMMGIMELSRGHSESRMKSERIGAAWENKREKARTTGAAISASCPHWLRRSGDHYDPIPNRAAAVRRMFELCADGFGINGIIRKLLEEGHKPFARSVKWSNSYIGRILGSRTVLGEYQPLKGKKPCGDPIQGFYPAVVDENLFYRARVGLKQRLNHAGGRSKHDVNIFQGLLRHATDGDRFEYRWFTDYQRGKKYGYARYVNSWALIAQAQLTSFPVAAFERGVLSCLSEINPMEILPTQGNVEADVSTLSAQYMEVDTQLRQIEDRLVNGEAVEVLMGAAKRLSVRKKELAEKLDAAELAASNPQKDAWGACHTLIDTLDATSDRETTRLRLQSAIRRVVDRLECLFVRNGRRQIACIQIHFSGSDAIRTVFVRYRGALVNVKETTPEFLSWSTLKDELPGKVDIKKQHRLVLPVLRAMCEENHWHKAFEPGRPTSKERTRLRKQEHSLAKRTAKR